MVTAGALFHVCDRDRAVVVELAINSVNTAEVMMMWWRRRWHPIPVLLPGKSHGLRSPVGYRPWSRKESDMTERLHL